MEEANNTDEDSDTVNGLDEKNVLKFKNNLNDFNEHIGTFQTMNNWQSIF